jgi:hypothetical protein
MPFAGAAAGLAARVAWCRPSRSCMWAVEEYSSSHLVNFRLSETRSIPLAGDAGEAFGAAAYL